jgi:hypothetical protein
MLKCGEGIEKLSGATEKLLFSGNFSRRLFSREFINALVLDLPGRDCSQTNTMSPELI